MKWELTWKPIWLVGQSVLAEKVSDLGKMKLPIYIRINSVEYQGYTKTAAIVASFAAVLALAVGTGRLLERFDRVVEDLKENKSTISDLKTKTLGLKAELKGLRSDVDLVREVFFLQRAKERLGQSELFSDPAIFAGPDQDEPD